MRATLHDIAKLASVSIATASRVLNNTGHPITEETRKRVLDAAKELNYRPNLHAKNLITGQNRILEMFWDIWFDSQGDTGVGVSLQRVIPAANQAAYEKGFQVIMDFSHLISEGNPRVFPAVIPISGAIVFAPRDNDTRVDRLAQFRIPFVIIGSSNYRQYNFVDTDHLTGAYIATHHLIELGHTDIICLGGPANYGPSLDGVSGYRRCMREHNLDNSDEKMIWRDNWTWENGFHMMNSVLRDRGKIPTAVFACNDMLALGAISAIKMFGLRVPEDIAVVGAGNHPASQLSDPPLTTMCHLEDQSARKGVECLIGLIEDPNREDLPFQDRFVPEMMIRQSCGYQLKHAGEVALAAVGFNSH